VTGRLRAFLLFWYDFIIGDDWRVALGVAAALALTGGLTTVHLPSWWLLPVAVGTLLPLSLWRAARNTRHGRAANHNTG
jgi:hypothetical protein